MATDNAANVPDDVEAFIARWQHSQASERANGQPFVMELCALLGVESPAPATGDVQADAYRFERPIDFSDGTKGTGFADLYKRGAFVLETKQGVDEDRAKAGKKKRKGHGVRGTNAWESTMEAARNQAEGYARNLESGEPVPPFVVACDIGYCFDLFSDFSGTGRVYVPFPSAESNRILLTDLRAEAVRDRLRLLFEDSASLDPSLYQAGVTQDLAERLGKLATSLEGSGTDPEVIAGFLSRCLFCLYAEDAGLIENDAFLALLDRYETDLERLPRALEAFFRAMDEGGYVGEVRADIPQFNGILFKQRDAPTLTAEQRDLLAEAARRDWRAVEPAIFGTLIERALDPEERHNLGAHFTPRAYVERLVTPAVLEPLREEWAGVRGAVTRLDETAETATKPADRQRAAKDAVTELATFQRRLATLRILDPACGSGNFLYVTFAGLKALEGEVRQALLKRGQPEILELPGVAVHPSQMRGIEVNARAAAIADLVLWIGYLQWYLRTHDATDALPEPILKGYGQVDHRDALLTEDGARAPWPDADFIVGNPPFLGKGEPMREALGDAYLDQLSAVYPEVPKSADFVMYWWERAARLVQSGDAERFGLITTNSITQTFNRRIVEAHLEPEDQGAAPLAVAFAVPDHPWVDRGAAVRVAMTAGASSARMDARAGVLATVIEETPTAEGYADVTLAHREGKIHADLTVGADVTQAKPLDANDGLSSFGMMLSGRGFVLSADEAAALRNEDPDGSVVRPLLNGRDLAKQARDRYVIDFYGLTAEQARERYPRAYDHLLREVKPVRDVNKRKATRENWWLFGEKRPSLRDAIEGLGRYIATPETAKHRLFQFLDVGIAPEHKIIAIALDDSYHLGILSSKAHEFWADAAGGNLGVGNDSVYNTTRCFKPFPFPDATEADRVEIRRLGDAIQRHREARQREHPALGLTDLYNAVEAIRHGRDLDAKEARTAEAGLAHTLAQLHADLDRAVFRAYGWDDLADRPLAHVEEVLVRLVALNAERAAEEDAGQVRYLRPTFQAPEGSSTQSGLTLAQAAPSRPQKAEPRPWPGRLPEQTTAVLQALKGLGTADATAVARGFSGAGPKTIFPILETLASLGQLREVEPGFYAV